MPTPPKAEAPTRAVGERAQHGDVREPRRRWRAGRRRYAEDVRAAPLRRALGLAVRSHAVVGVPEARLRRRHRHVGNLEEFHAHERGLRRRRRRAGVVAAPCRVGEAHRRADEARPLERHLDERAERKSSASTYAPRGSARRWAYAARAAAPLPAEAVAASATPHSRRRSARHGPAEEVARWRNFADAPSAQSGRRAAEGDDREEAVVREVGELADGVHELRGARTTETERRERGGQRPTAR